MTSTKLGPAELPTWHQQQAARRNYGLRNHAAHILSDQWLFTGLAVCGLKDPRVWVHPDKSQKPENRVCKRCQKVIERRRSISH